MSKRKHLIKVKINTGIYLRLACILNELLNFFCTLISLCCRASKQY